MTIGGLNAWVLARGLQPKPVSAILVLTLDMELTSTAHTALGEKTFAVTLLPNMEVVPTILGAIVSQSFQFLGATLGTAE